MTVIVENNRFDYNRHTVAGSGERGKFRNAQNLILTSDYYLRDLNSNWCDRIFKYSNTALQVKTTLPETTWSSTTRSPTSLTCTGRTRSRTTAASLPAERCSSTTTQSWSWLPDGYSQIFRSYVFGPSGYWTMAPLCTLQNVIPSFPWIVPGWRAWRRNPR